MRLSDFILARCVVESAVETRMALNDIVKNMQNYLNEISLSDFKEARELDGVNSWWRDPIFTALEEKLFFEKDGYVCAIRCACKNTMKENIPLNPFSDIRGLTAYISGDSDYSIEVRYNFSFDERNAFANACLKTQKALVEEMNQEPIEQEVDIDETTI